MKYTAKLRMMEVYNIDIESFMLILKTFHSQKYKIFGMTIEDGGKKVTLYPLKKPDSTDKGKENDEDDDSKPTKDLKIS